MIKVKDSKSKKDKFIITMSDDKFKITSNKNKATKFKYFGLKEMESTIKVVMEKIFYLKYKGVDGNLIIVGEDVLMNFDDIKSEDFQNRVSLWSRVTGADTLKNMIKMSKDEDNEFTENYVYIHKFLSHVISLNYSTVINQAKKWGVLSEKEQIDFAINQVGEYSASRFIIFMDYVSSVLFDNNVKSVL